MIQETWNFCEKKYEEEFEIWWNACPKKVGKPRAFLLWKKLQNREPESLPSLSTWIDAYARKVHADQLENRFILHPATILSQRRWEDKIDWINPSDNPAEIEWNIIIEYLKKFGQSSDQPLPLSDIGKKALQIVGGRWNLAMSTEWTNEHVHKKIFLLAYK